MCVEWVDAEGWTVCERAAAAGEVPAEVARWSREGSTALWVVDGWDDGRVLLRDLATEAEVAVDAAGLEAELPRRTVLRARVVPWGDRWSFTGEPGVYGVMGVVARLDLLAQWRAGPEPALLDELRELRAGFLRQREERAAFVEHFGSDEVVFPDADALETALVRFVDFLLHRHAVPSLGGRTRAEAWRTEKGSEPAIVQWRLGDSLRGPGRPGAIYDVVEGIHFLPAYGEFRDHVAGVAEHPELYAAYLDDPGITDLPFRRAGRPGTKPREGRPTPSVLPGIAD